MSTSGRLLRLWAVAFGVAGAAIIAPGCGNADHAAGYAAGDGTCLDNDGDGFGVGCFAGPDCNDNDPTVTCNGQSPCEANPYANGCACAEEGSTHDCGKVTERSGNYLTCGYGSTRCSGGVWTDCTIDAHESGILSLPRLLALGAAKPCLAAPCDPYCHQFTDIPDQSILHDGGRGGPDGSIGFNDGGMTLNPLDGSVVAITGSKPDAAAPPPPPPTLTHADLTVPAFSCPATVEVGGTLTCTVTLENTGQTSAPTFTNDLRLSTDTTIDNTDVLLEYCGISELDGGAPVTLTCSGTVPVGTATGPYYGGLVADSGNTVVESDETNNTASALVTVVPPTTLPPPLPSPADLIIQSFTCDASVDASATLKCTVVIVNQGGQFASSFNDSLWLSTDATIDPADTHLTDCGVAGLNGGGATATVVCTATVPVATPAGPYTAGIVLDSGATVVETDETNNTGTTAVTVTTPAAPTSPPDLIVSNVTCPASVSAGDTAACTIQVTNTGGTATLPFTNELRLSTDLTIDGADTLLGTCSVSGLAAGASAAVKCAGTVPLVAAPGSYYAGAIEDSTNTVAESNEANNTGYAPIAVLATPPAGTPADLAVTALSCVPSPSVGTSQNIVCSATIANNGGTWASKFQNELRLSTDGAIDSGDLLLGNCGLSALNPGQSTTVTCAGTIPAATIAGSYYVGVIADSANAVTELDETNNTRSVSETVTASGPVITPPDIQITSVSCPASVDQSATLACTVTFTNAGGTYTGPFKDEIWISTAADQSVGVFDTKLGNCDLDALDGGASATVACAGTVPAATPAGTYYAGVIADSTNIVVESDETNNTAWSGAITVNAPAVPPTPPNIVPSFVSCTTPVAQGDTLSCQVTFTNTGGSAAGGFMNELRLTTTGGPVLGTCGVGYLAAGTATTVTCSGQIPIATAVGPNTVWVVADSTNAVLESNETDNKASLAISVTAAPATPEPDLVVSSIACPATAASGDQVLCDVAVTNNGGLAVGSFTNTISLNGALLGTCAVGSLAAFTTTTVKCGGASAAFPTGTPRSISATADFANIIAESNDGNNTLTSGTITLTAQPPVYPDLVVTSVTCAPAPPNPVDSGSSISCTVGLQNQGTNGTTSTFVNALNLSNSNTTPGGSTIGTCTSAAIAGGGTASIVCTGTVPAATAAGTYYVLADTDSANAVTEANSAGTGETNNWLASAPFTVATPTLPRPDLTVVGLSCSNSTGTSTAVDPSSTVSCTFGVRNQGPVAAGAFANTLKLASDAALTANVTALSAITCTPSFSPGGLAADTTTTGVQCTGTLPAACGTNFSGTCIKTPGCVCNPGAYYIGVAVDSASAVTESSETNNTASAVLTVPEFTHNVVLDPGQSAGPIAAPSNIFLGLLCGIGSFTGFSVVDQDDASDFDGPPGSPPYLTPFNCDEGGGGVCNNVAGRVTSPNGCGFLGFGACNAMFVSKLSGSFLSTPKVSYSVPAAFPKQCYDQIFRFSVSAFIGCDLPVTITIPGDPTMASCKTPPPSIASNPDLVANSVTCSTAVAGGTTTCDLSISNIGVVDAPAFSNTVTFPAASGIAGLTCSAADGLTAGTTTTVQCTGVVPAGTAAGTYSPATATVDSGNVVKEADETTASNTATTSITVTAAPVVTLPDLIVTGVTCTPVSQSGTLTCVVTEENQGGSAVGGFTTTVTTGIAGMPAMACTMSGLAAGQTGTTTCTGTVPAGAAPGIYSVTATANSPSSWSESNAGNNGATNAVGIAVGTTSVSKPDLVITGLACPASLTAGSTLACSVTVQNQGGSWAGPFTNTVTSSAGSIATCGVGGLAAFASTTVSCVGTVPSGTAAGLYSAAGAADSTNAIAELVETNNTDAVWVSVSAATVAPAATDLSVASLTCTPAMVDQRATVACTATLKNGGGIPAGPFTNQLVLSADTTITNGAPDVVLTSCGTSYIGASTTTTVTCAGAIPSGWALGAANAGLIVDSGNAVLESNEANNTASAAITVSAADPGPALPNLVTTSLSCPASAAQGDPLTCTLTVTNNGGTAVNAFMNDLRLSANTTIDAADTLLGNCGVSGLGAGLSATVTCSGTIPAGTATGPWYAGIIADSGNAVPESNEANNTASTPFVVTTAVTTSPPADLSVSSLTCSPSVVQGDTLSCSVTLANTGGTATGPFNDELRLSSDTTIDASDLLLGNCGASTNAAGGSVTFTCAGPIASGTATGTWYAGIIADSGNVVPESNEANNTASAAFTVTAGGPAPLPDLVVSSVTCPATVAQGDTLTCDVNVSNFGFAGVSGPFTNDLRLSTDTTIDGADVLLGNCGAAYLAASGTVDLKCSGTIPLSTPVGSYFAGGLADSTNSVVESNETNNTGSTSIQVTAAPTAPPPVLADLAVTSMTCPATVPQGGTLACDVTITNSGATNAGVFEDELRLSADSAIDTTDTLLGHCGASGVAAGGSVTVTCSGMVPASATLGAQYSGVIVDSANAVSESDETNNVASKPVTVVVAASSASLADLVVQSVSCPAVVDPGAAISCTVVLENQGGTDAPAFMDEFRLSTDSTIDASDTLLGTCASPALTAGTSTTITCSGTLPASTTRGVYLYAGIVADSTNVAAESDENNNTSYASFLVSIPPPAYGQAWYERTYDGSALCPRGYNPVWGVFGWSASTPKDAYISFYVQTGNTTAELDAAPLELTAEVARAQAASPVGHGGGIYPSVPGTGDTQSGTVIVNDVLTGTSQPPNETMLRVRANMVASSDALVSPSLASWGLQVSCVATR